MTRAYLALAAICIIWGTTYTVIKLAVRDFPPYLLVGIRQTLAGLLLLGLALAGGHKKVPGRRYVLRQGLTGLATITGGNGFITWGMQYVSSGLAAIIGSLTPVLVVFINLSWRGSEKINSRIVTGVLIGFAGLGLIFNDGWQDFIKPEYRLGIAGCFASCFTWSLGTVMSKRWNSPEVPPLLNAGMQITAGGLGGLVFEFFPRQYPHDTPHHAGLAGGRIPRHHWVGAGIYPVYVCFATPERNRFFVVYLY
ncbi:MAG: DMT family transporter [Lewinellaceae bacterium]|nr:DMT family transporter [Lewinellaceae bacterium]